MADVFSSAFTTEQHAQWAASQVAWDPSQLHVIPTASPGSISEGAPSEQASDGLGSSTGAQRDQSLGPLPIGWQEGTRGGSGGLISGGGKEAKGAHARAPKGPLVCQVEACGHDLSLEKGYYQRYRVCEPHMKLLSLVVNGKPCRFCQQCGRFQELTEFDGNKRSCRARLLQHNARRRKRDPLDTTRKEQPNSRKSKSSHPWSDSSNDADMGSGDVGQGFGADKTTTNYSMDSGVDQSGKLCMGYGNVSQMSTGAGQAWGPGLTSLGEMVETPAGASQVLQQQLQAQEQSQQLLNADLARCFSGAAELGGSLDDMLDGILGTNMDYLEDPRLAVIAQRSDVRGSFTGPASGGGISMGGGMSGSLPYVDSQAMQFEAFNRQGHNGGIPMGKQGPAFTSSVPTSGKWQSGAVADAGPPSASDLAAALNKRAMQQRQLQELQMQQQQLLLHQQLLQQQVQQQPPYGGFHRGAVNTGGSLEYVQSGGSTGASTFEPPSSGQYGSAAGAMFGRGNGPWSAHNISTPMSGTQVLSGGVSLHSNANQSTISLNATAPSMGGGASASVSSSFDLARRLVASGGAAAKYESEDLLVRVSIKIANCTPDQLPSDLYQRLRNLLNTADASLVQGFLRPGCTHLVLDVQVGSGSADAFEQDGGPKAGSDGPALCVSLQQLRSVLGSVASRSAVLVQSNDEVALWRAGDAASARPHASARISELSADGRLPVIEHVSAAAHVDATGRASVVVYGTCLMGAGVKLFARIQGGYLPVSVEPLVVDGAPVPSSPSAPAAASAAALRCTSSLQRCGRKATDAVLLTVHDAPGSGLMFVEAQAGPLLSNWRPCLLLTDRSMAGEVSGMGGRVLRAGASALASLEAFVRDLGRVLDRRSYFTGAPALRPSAAVSADPDGAVDDGHDEEYDEVSDLDCQDSATSHDGEDVMAMVCGCERMLAWATDMGAVGVASFLAAVLRQYGQDMQAILEAPYADGLSIVHRCIRSGSAKVVQALIGWAASSRVNIAWGSTGALGLSPLHLAAVVPSVWRTLAATAAARQSWESAAAACGDIVTPVQIQRMLLARLPAGVVLTPDVVQAFAPPRPRPAAAVTQLQTVSETKPAEKAGVAATPTQAAEVRRQIVLPPMVGIASTVLVFTMAVVLFALQPAAYRASAADGAPRNARHGLLQRLAPEYENVDHTLIFNCCTSMLYVGLLGMAMALLPVKNMLTGVHPASTCLGAP